MVDFTRQYVAPTFDTGRLSKLQQPRINFATGGPILLSINPNLSQVSPTALTITLTGLFFHVGAVAYYNGTALFTTFIDSGHLTAVIPSALLGVANVGVNKINVVNVNG